MNHDNDWDNETNQTRYPKQHLSQHKWGQHNRMQRIVHTTINHTHTHTQYKGLVPRTHTHKHHARGTGQDGRDGITYYEHKHENKTRDRIYLSL